jgi:hypothetical protein
MKRILLLLLLVLSVAGLYAQKDTVNLSSGRVQRVLSSEATVVNISIFPVPVRDNFFNIRSDREFVSVKITNIIGQDIIREKYNEPQSLVRIMLESPKRGMYLVTVGFSDGLRVVKKIMIEQTE